MQETLCRIAGKLQAGRKNIISLLVEIIKSLKYEKQNSPSPWYFGWLNRLLNYGKTSPNSKKKNS